MGTLFISPGIPPVNIFGCKTSATVYSRAMSLPGRNKAAVTKVLAAEARKLKNEGMSYSAIARLPHFNMSHQAVQRMITDQPKMRNSKCPMCGRDCNCLHRHHTNYLKDEVVHLCPSCHGRMKKVPINSEELLKLGRSLSGLRLRAGRTLRGFAKDLGISHTYLWQLENGKRNWPVGMAEEYRRNL